MSENLLAQETSPYLLQHRDNPVHWRPWGAAALAEAKATNKPILLSVGYAACHWCHVMAHESFEDPAIARLMNQLFINIKVDREERPDLDAIYQQALMLLGEHGGWPLTMFLTPDAEPFWGGTYFPPTSRYGRPGFSDVLQAVSATFARDGEKVQKNVDALRVALGKMSDVEPGEQLTPARWDEVAKVALRMVDPYQGGTLGAPKFPQPNFFGFLWQAYESTRATMFRDAVTVTLDRMCQGGIYDHLGGGFARYSTDEVWLAPHFEKMLYDNALLVELMTRVWCETRSDLYLQRIDETVDWVLRDLRAPLDAGDGDLTAFASAYDADSEGEEGKFYVWSEGEIDDLLGPDADVFKRHYDVSQHGNWEGHCILNRSHNGDMSDPAVEYKLAACRATLLQERAERIAPERDHKILADWNGMMIAALVEAGGAFDRPDWIAAAKRAFDFVVTNMSVEEGGGNRLYHTWCQGRARHPAVIEDYAHMARAAIKLYEITGDSAYLKRAEAWVAVADEHYWDSDGTGYFMSADDTDDVIHRTKSIHDNAVPSGNGMMTAVLTLLAYHTGTTGYADRARAICDHYAAAKIEQMINMPSLMTYWRFLYDGTQMVVAAGDDSLGAEALLSALRKTPPGIRAISCVIDGNQLAGHHPAFGKGPVDGKAAAYICNGPTCTPPITDPASIDVTRK